MAGLFDGLSFGGLLGGASGYLSPKSNMLTAMGAGLLSGNNWQSGFGNLAQGLMAGKALDQKAAEAANQKSALKAYAAENNLTPAQMQFMSAYPEVGAKALAEKMTPKDDVRVVNGAIVAKQPDGTYKPVYQSPEVTKPEMSLSPVWATDPQGNNALLQLSKAGGAQPVKLPDGYRLNPGVKMVDTGTGVVAVDSRTGLPTQQFQKDIAGAAQQKEVGKVSGQAAAQVPQFQTMAADVRKTVDEIKTDPALSNALGWLPNQFPTVRPDTARVESKIDKLSGQSFLQARQLLKGGGAITDFESKRAEAAYARLTDKARLMTQKDYTAALDEFVASVDSGLAKLQMQSKLSGQQQAPQSTGNVSIDDLLKKYGGQ